MKNEMAIYPLMCTNSVLLSGSLRLLAPILISYLSLYWLYNVTVIIIMLIRNEHYALLSSSTVVDNGGGATTLLRRNQRSRSSL